MKKVAIIGDGKKKGVESAAAGFVGRLDGKADVVLIDTKGVADLSSLNADVLVVFGGDGSMLSSARRLNGLEVPVVGVNMGRFGFLTHFEAQTVNDDFQEFLDGSAVVSSWTMMTCDVCEGSRSVFGWIALNEVFLGGGSFSRMVSIDLVIDGEGVASYRGDGVIVATPAGSTAHSLSAGGPIVSSFVDALLLTPVCAHTLTNRPLVVPPRSEIVLRPTEKTCLTVDGQTHCEVSSGQEVSIKRAPFTFNVVMNSSRTYYQSLKGKLNWGKSPVYGND